MVFGIAGAAILADWRTRVVGTIKAIVAGFAEATERAQAKGGEVTSVRLDVISDRRWHDAARFQAQPAQWLDMQLVPPAAQPTCRAIPSMLFAAVGHHPG